MKKSTPISADRMTISGKGICQTLLANQRKKHCFDSIETEREVTKTRCDANNTAVAKASLGLMHCTNHTCQLEKKNDTQFEIVGNI